jgi:C-terminal processing protease CtpA/Prc
VNQGLADATSNGADQDTIDQYQIYQNEFQSAFLKNQGRTNRIPVCAATATRSPAASAYTKPVLVMADELSASSADIFAAMIQDNHIAPLFGYRTMGAGGSPEDNYVGVYSEGSTSVTRSMIVRLQPVTISGYPTTSYIENVGVHPDILVDYMTTDNLLNKGAPFVKAFTDAAVALIKK